jgi:hypothetical protein
MTVFAPLLIIGHIRRFQLRAGWVPLLQFGILPYCSPVSDGNDSRAI